MCNASLTKRTSIVHSQYWLRENPSYNFLVFKLPTAERSDRKDLLSSGWLTLFFLPNWPLALFPSFWNSPKTLTMAGGWIILLLWWSSVTKTDITNCQLKRVSEFSFQTPDQLEDCESYQPAHVSIQTVCSWILIPKLLWFLEHSLPQMALVYQHLQLPNSSKKNWQQTIAMEWCIGMMTVMILVMMCCVDLSSFQSGRSFLFSVATGVSRLATHNLVGTHYSFTIWTTSIHSFSYYSMQTHTSV